MVSRQWAKVKHFLSFTNDAAAAVDGKGIWMTLNSIGLSKLNEYFRWQWRGILCIFGASASGVFQGVDKKSKQDGNTLVSCCFEGGQRLFRFMAGFETALVVAYCGCRLLAWANCGSEHGELPLYARMICCRASSCYPFQISRLCTVSCIAFCQTALWLFIMSFLHLSRRSSKYCPFCLLFYNSRAINI